MREERCWTCMQEAVQLALRHFHVDANVLYLQILPERQCPVSEKDMAVLQKLAQEGRQLSLVYLDPPYAKAHHDEVLSFLCENGMLEHGARVVIESLKEEVYDRDYPSLHPYKDKVYGITRITY